MGYRLALAEKPSVAQAIAKVIGATKRCDGYLEGNGQPCAVILPVNSANIQFAWGGTNCSTEIFTGLDRIEPAESSEKEKLDQDDAADSDSTADAGTDTEGIRHHGKNLGIF